MAFVAPAFLLLIFAIVEVALWMHSRNVALASAREGVSELRTVAPKGARRSGSGSSSGRPFAEAMTSAAC